ncbi:MAG: hypothetical protein KAW17_10980 [Candidatus Eisenbacteria sp.]|nr:hypothetical protein [Candidatus Eisenbacteria bacterium]
MIGRIGITLLVGGLALVAAPCVAETQGRQGTLGQVAAELFAARRAEALESIAAGPQSGSTSVSAAISRPGKSGRKAFFLSLLLPGLGQRYLGQEYRSRIYMGAEAAVWITVASFWLQGSLREDRYREFAEIVGGADSGMDNDDYYKDLALYGSSDVHSMVIRWEARALFPDDRDARGRYYAENIYPESEAWSWPDAAAFDEYQRLRRRSKRAYRTAVNVIGLVVLNRLVSAIDTVTGKEKEEFAGGWVPQFSVRALPGDDAPAASLHLHRSF